MDRPDYPELGTSAEMIGSRLMWLIGYHVPATYLVTIQGTGDSRFDHKRATASLFVTGEVLGGFKFDHFRMRREVRAMRLVSAWLNDTDRGDNNTLAAVEGGRVTCYFIDFNSCLGSWNGRPKDDWRGWRHAWDVEYQLLGFFTLGVLPSPPPPGEIRSPAIGRRHALGDCDAKSWKSQNFNTAFDRLTFGDAAWVARRMADVSRAQLEAVVSSAEYSERADAEITVDTLIDRRSWVLRSWGLEGLLASDGPG
jgi:hypothetical protein